NHNLNLKTNTLSYENLSNTSYAKGTNFSIGANYILEDKNNKDSKSNNNQEDKFTGLKSIDLSNHRNLSYSLSKNLATLGSGNIEIADKDSSDDLTRLNRDTTKLTKDLVNTSISSNVDGSMDLRVLTKSGQKDIKDEFNTATAITKALNAIIETGELNFNSEVKENVAQYEAGKLLGKELAQKLTDDSVTIEEKEALGNKFIELFASKAGLDLNGISLRIIDDKFAKGKDDEKFLGHFNSGSIILNLAHIKNVDQFVSTLGHELKHAMDYKAGKFIPGDSKQDRYAKLKENSFSDYLSKALNLQDSGINAKDAAINYIKNQSSLNTLLLNSYMFNGLDKSKGDNSPLLLAGVVIEKTIEIAPLIFGSWLVYNNASKDKDSSHEIFPSDEISTLPGTIFPKEESNKNDNILTTPQTEQYDKITNGGVNTDNSFNEPYLGGIEGKEQNFKDNVYFAEKDKKLSNGEISKLKKNGIDPHDLKPHSDYDLYKDKKGNIFVKLKNGKGQGEPTGYNINDF
ncbi:polymorphic toxin type 33 domain-containing protein, partial [Campylobacter concisus]